MHDAPTSVTYLFSDIEGSTRLWEQQPELMRPALARHDTLARDVVVRHRGDVVKMTGDGVHAAFADALDAVAAVLELQQAMVAPPLLSPDIAPDTAPALPLHVRFGLHAGSDERRDNDYFGPAVNRAARIMSVAHGGQVLVSQAVADLVRDRLPAEIALRDLGNVRLRDLASAERIYQVVHPSLRADFPALRSLEATPNNLAQQLNSFIGRERETAEVRELLGANRLVTLLGMGGIGKSRLSVQLGADALDDYPDGVWLVELAPLSDPLLVPQAVASVLGVKEEAGRPVLEALVRFVRDRQLLIILDNCEHIVHACADLAKQLLQAGARLKVLASSRDYLQVAGERTYHVPTLSSPQPAHHGSVATLAEHESVRLFVDRVAAARPGFVLSERNAAAVADICHRLDGIPLALELAAARARSVSVENIAARLGDRFRLLVTNDRTVLPRQRTLRALIDWSYDLLDTRERLLFQRLSVFAGGWTLEAAESVCAGGELDAADVLDLQTQLVEKSLVAMDLDGARYRMLDTVRHYAREKLEEAGDAAATQARHLDYFVAAVEQARPHLVGPEQGPWLDRLDRERENVLVAHEWVEAIADKRALKSRLIRALRMYFFSRGLLSLGLRLYLNLLADDELQTPSGERCRVLFGAGQIYFFIGQYADARRCLDESLAIAQSLGDESALSAVLIPLGMACLGERDFNAARAHLEHALARCRESDDKRELFGTLTAMSMLHRATARLDLAEPACDEALALARESGDYEGIGRCLLNLAMISIGLGRVARAPALLLEAMEIAARIGSRTFAQYVLDTCAGLCSASQQPARAVTLFAIAEAQRAALGLRRDPADESFVLPLIDAARAALTEDERAVAEQAARAAQGGDPLALAASWIGAPARETA